MRVFAGFLLILSLQLICVAAEPPQDATAGLRGIVRQARNGEPVAGSQVILSKGSLPPGPTTVSGQTIIISSSQTIATLTTASDGQFRFEGLAAGPYSLTVTVNGFVRNDSTRIVLVAGQLPNDVVVRMKQTASVTGRVRSTTGRPLSGVRVSLLRRIYTNNGVENFSRVANVRTNDLGEYRLFWLTPGRYYVSAEGESLPVFFGALDTFDEGVRRGNNEVQEEYALSFFPGTTEWSSATPIELQEGAEVGGIDFSLRRQAIHRILGRLVDATTGKAPSRASVTISERNLNGGSTSGVIYKPDTGTFEIPNLKPGRYGIAAGIALDDLISGSLFNGAPVGVPYAATEVVITDSNVEDVELILSVRPFISGSIRIEGELPASTAVDRFRVSLVPSTSTASIFGNPGASVKPDRSFTLATPVDVLFRVTMSGLPQQFYLKEVTLDGIDVLDTPSKFSSSGKLEILISGSAGRLEGRVLDSQKRPLPGIEAILVPNAMRDHAELFKRATTNADGRFGIAGIRPGDYKLFAWESLEPNSFFDEKILKKFEELGTPIQIQESSRNNVDLKVIPAETER